MKRSSRIAVIILSLLASLLFNALLFGFLPVMSYLHVNAENGSGGKAAEQPAVLLPMLNKKKEKPKADESLKPAEKKMAAPGKTIARQRFVMDLGPGGGSGAGGGVAVSQGDLQQVTYEEGDVDEEAELLTKNIAIVKPKKAEAAGVGGVLRCLFTIGENGQVADIQFLEIPAPGYGFEDAARQFAAALRFKPAKVGGIAVRVKYEQSIKF